MSASRLRRRFLVAMGLPAIAGALPAFACTKDGAAPLVSVPLADGDASAVATATTIDAGKPASTTTASVKTFHDPPEPVPPRWSHTTTNICPENLDAPESPELPSPFEQCPKNANGGQFSAKATRAQRADNPDACCYVMFHGMPVPGRALRDAHSSEPAVASQDVDRSDWTCDALAIDVECAVSLSSAERELLAHAWREDAAFEHASVAAFARFALDLMALGAPPHLVARAHAAATDEVAHAQTCHSIARAYDGRALGPAPLRLAPRESLPSCTELAVETFLEGCVGETIAAMSAREASRRTESASIRHALSKIADDEERHAELAFSALAWLVEAGGDEARLAVANALSALSVGPDDARVGGLAAHGRLDAGAARRVRERAIAGVVEPCTLALLHARVARQRPTSASIAARS